MKWSIGYKILGIFGLSTLVSVLVSILAYQGTNQTIDSAERVKHTHAVIQELQNVLSAIKDQELGSRGFTITGNPAYLDVYSKGVRELDPSVGRVQGLTSDNPSQQGRIAELRTQLANKVTDLALIVRTRREGSFEDARRVVLTDRGKSAMDRVRELIAEARQEEFRLLEERDRENRRLAGRTRAIILGGVALAVLAWGAMALFMRRKVIDPLLKMVGVARGISEGDLRQETLPVDSNDEIGDLSLAMNSVLGTLRELAEQNIAAAKTLAGSVAEILASIQQQASASRQQATSIQQTTTTMEEISQSGAQVAERAKQVAASAEATSVAGNQGITAVQGTHQVMQGIRMQVESVAQNIVNLSERNQTIGEIVSSVNDIAEQSNLLALNASIEAAAAGEFGRRFSVVAAEMKNLAEQAKGSTVQVRSILGDIQKGINSSVMLTEEAVKRSESGRQQSELAEQTIRSLTTTSHESVRAFQQIVGATSQQQIGFDQITQALRAIRIGAEQTAASTSQLEKAAISMNGLGQQLQKAVERFKV